MTDDTGSAAEALASWGTSLLPTDDDMALAQRALLDTVAVGVAARDHHVVRVGAGLTRAARFAAACHVLDYDDVHMESTTHISTVCAPVAFDQGGDAYAYLAGAGVMARIGAALGWPHYSSGWHATTTAGALGAATTAAVSRGLSSERVACAMALAVPAAGGVQRAFGTDGKSLQIGFAAEAGIRAAELAAAGATADGGAVDDWMRMVGGDPSAVDLSGPAVPGGLAVKIYPACYALQRPISAVRSALAEESRPDPSTIRKIVVRTPAATVQPLIHHHPRTGLQGKFSLEYAIATALLDRHHGFEEFSDEAVLRPEAQRLIELVETDLSEDGDWLLSGKVGIEVHTADGTLAASLQYPPGAPRRPPSDGELADKVDRCLAGSGVDAAEITWAGSAGVLDRTLAR